MESLATISSNLKTSDSSEKITSDLSRKTRRRNLFLILTEYREVCQHPPLTGDEMEIRINSWVPVTAPIPAERLHDCYVWAMQNRDSQFPLKATELLDAWKHLLQRAETEGASNLRDDRLLPERAKGACLRCDKEGREIMLDGSIGGQCKHQPFTEEEKQQASKIKSEIIAQARAEAEKRIQAQKKAQVEGKPKFFHLRMECSHCHRRVDNPMGEAWKEGDKCGALLLDQTCEGTFHAIKKIVSPFQ